MSPRFQCLFSSVQFPCISWLGISLYWPHLSWSTPAERLVLFPYAKQGLHWILENTLFFFREFLAKSHGWLAAPSLARPDLRRHPCDFSPRLRISGSWELFSIPFTSCGKEMIRPYHETVLSKNCSFAAWEFLTYPNPDRESSAASVCF